ncbi:cysteine-rich receptor-like protein kinase 2 [Malania oleifera]|uniref:cysteine-rich receptor-like protein kinase 2 n=1 Tax=Malania oleifera TaxID=397392 RepID=UPI0025ADBE94|nr:cysteine-rich receptor-like protein kinase 2 [Malania oleifera]
MAKLTQQAQSSGFGVAATGTSGPDPCYALFQCYGDLSPVDCAMCYAQARTLLPVCSFSTFDARIYFDGCFVRADSRYPFFDEISGPQDTAVCGNSTRKRPAFQAAATRAVREAAAAAPGNDGYARAQAAVSPSAVANESAYVLANCWKSLSVKSCRACLENASRSILGCLPWSEGRALNTGCFMRYSDTDFLNAEKGKGGFEGKTIGINAIAISVVSSITILILVVAIWLHAKKQMRIRSKRRASNYWNAKILQESGLNFKFATLEKATGFFSDANKLGQGGFGTVYKGVLADGREIAVKRLFFNNTQRAADFYNEVNIISRVEHKNLVRLLGCSCSGPESLLVYELIPNQSLDRFLFDPNKGKILNWEKRYEIITGIAEGLVYLHENTNIKIIHRDIKVSNILLDFKFQAKIADFGLARSFHEDKSHISTAIAGTLGYMAPEYVIHGRLTEKADVYSFGVLLLEIVTGRQNNKAQATEFSFSLVITAWKQFLQQKVEELIDPNLKLGENQVDDKVTEEALRVVHIGVLCTQEIPSMRPTMVKVLKMLSKKEVDLPTPTNPPFIHKYIMELNFPINAIGPTSNATMSYNSFCPR